MALSSGSPPRNQPEPAWKRLGLKLKYAKESSEPGSLERPESAKPSETHAENLTAERLANDEQPLPKRRKTTSHSNDELQDPVANSVAVPSSQQSSSRTASTDQDHSLRAEPTIESIDRESSSANDNQRKPADRPEGHFDESATARPRRKSVTFSTDTKEEGKGSLSAQERSTNREVEADNLEQPHSIPEKTKKRKKRDQDRALPNSASSKDAKSPREGERGLDGHTPEYITYLQLFHRDRPSWKFNKNNQKGLIKNLFRIDRIPSEYNEAITSYISGLQGAAAKRRVIESADSVLKELAERDSDSLAHSEMESEEARRSAYYAALQRHLEKYENANLHRDEYDDLQLEDMRRESERGKRAEAVLRELLTKELHPEQTPAASESTESSKTLGATGTSQTQSTNTTPRSTSKSISKAGSKRKRRKARTQGSASFSSSDSETSESEGEYNPERGPATIHDALRAQPSPQLQNLSKSSTSPRPVTAKKKIFDDEFLDQIFPKKQSYHDTAPKRRSDQLSKPRGFAYTHGIREDESGSEDE